MTALQQKDMLKDSIIVFTTDNGGPAAGFNQNAASNWPLRGVKDTLWEGGVRGSALVWSPRLKTRGRVSSQMMAIHDWLPTLYSAAGGQPSDLDNVDGMDMWSALVEDTESPRNIILHNIDQRRLISALRVGDYKLIRGTSYNGAWDGWHGPSGRDDDLPHYDIANVRGSPAGKAIASAGVPLPDDKTIASLRAEADVTCTKPDTVSTCDPTWQVCLFNIKQDPCEQNNLLFQFPDIVKVKNVQF